MTAHARVYLEAEEHEILAARNAVIAKLEAMVRSLDVRNLKTKDDLIEALRVLYVDTEHECRPARTLLVKCCEGNMGALAMDFAFINHMRTTALGADIALEACIR